MIQITSNFRQRTALPNPDSSLDSLPNEVLEQILTKLPFKHGITLLVNSRWRSLTLSAKISLQRHEIQTAIQILKPTLLKNEIPKEVLEGWNIDLQITGETLPEIEKSVVAYTNHLKSALKRMPSSVAKNLLLNDEIPHPLNATFYEVFLRELIEVFDQKNMSRIPQEKEAPLRLALTRLVEKNKIQQAFYLASKFCFDNPANTLIACWILWAIYENIESLNEHTEEIKTAVLSFIEDNCWLGREVSNIATLLMIRLGCNEAAISLWKNRHKGGSKLLNLKVFPPFEDDLLTAVDYLEAKDFSQLEPLIQKIHNSIVNHIGRPNGSTRKSKKCCTNPSPFTG